ncbi:hypothetical protein LTR41_009630 [Exophiala xenobiotica]|nr:hypothetical protein LTR41_009630 [Exophiala xenobiotica]KAK5409532.1 hypothetical protein LTR06_007105 [Exophiala xenobiotica]KAK5435906.1 hypothetical protein LTR18_009908 [Exophiala xenobiotica]KAK5474974.1 hypothetical protein LTR55_009592 [Exophiala xenobiotica]KAK5542791.1 hypothetical protein LTR23_005401 [Chaetothyriales sp. CCFEE 6169]
MANFAPVRRIITHNSPLSPSLADNSGAQPAVVVHSEMLTSPDLGNVMQLGASCTNTSIFSHAKVPTSNSGPEDVQPDPIPPPGIYLPAGIHVTYSQAAPGFRVPLHRTTSTDYVFIHSGELTLVTPSTEYDATKGQGELQETICRAGDVIMQRGTMHGWANKGTEVVQYFAIMIGSDPVTTEISGKEERLTLPDWFPGQ